MKTRYLSLIVTSGIAIFMMAIVIHSQVFAQDLGGPVKVAHYQISQILAIGDDLYVMYQENSNSGHGNVFFRSSTDGGKNFGNIIKINNADEASAPYLAVSKNNVYVAWNSFSLGDNSKHVLFRKSTDDGNTFGGIQFLDSQPQSGDTFIEQLVANGSNVYALMRYGNTTGNWNLFLKESNDYGETFGKTLVLNDDGGSWMMSKIAVSGTNVYVSSEDSRCLPMCRQSDIVLRHSVDNGATFGNLINLSKGDDISNFHQMVASGNNVYLAWQEGQPDIFFAKSTDRDTVFGPKIDLTRNIGESTSVHLAAQGNNVYVAFDHYYNPNIKNNYPEGIYFTKSSNGGSTFNVPVLMHGIEGSGIFGLAAGANNVFLLYDQSDILGNQETLLEKSTDNGTTFTTPVVVNKGLSWTAGFEGLGKGMAVNKNHVYAIFRSPMPVDSLYLSASSDGGKTFGGSITLNDGTISTYQEPPFFICCITDVPWFHNAWLWTGVVISTVIGTWLFIFHRFKE